MPHDHAGARTAPHESRVHRHHAPLRWSFLRVSAAQRLGGVVMLMALLWLAVVWALA